MRTTATLRPALKGKAPGLRTEQRLWQAGNDVVVGVDEVGRGSWAGPLTVGAVVANAHSRIYKVRDSKMLTPREREILYDRIRRWARAVSVAHATVEECTALGMADAQRLAARRAIDALGLAVDHVLVDGAWDFITPTDNLRSSEANNEPDKKSPTTNVVSAKAAKSDRRNDDIDGRSDGVDGRNDGIDGRSEGVDGRNHDVDGCNDDVDAERRAVGVTTIVRGDAQSLSIAAASVVAKVTRDRIMTTAADLYPGYWFASNKGYPCPRHRAALAAWGPSAIHRRRWVFMDNMRWTGVPRIVPSVPSAETSAEDNGQRRLFRPAEVNRPRPADRW